LCKERVIASKRESAVTKDSNRRGRAGAVHQRNEDEEVNKRQKTQAPRTHKNPS
jgi:hypothetical protein